MIRKISTLRLALLVGSLLALLSASLAWASHDIPAWLTQVMGAPDAPTYTIYYATSCPAAEPGCTPTELVPTADGDGDGFPDAVELMSGYLEGSRTAFVTTFGMLEPYFNGAPSRPAYMSGGCWGSYNGHNMWMCAQGTSADWVQAKSTALHELFHGVQWAYSGSGPQPGWVIEGQAAFMEDQVFADLDANAGTFLFSQGEVYLSDPNLFAVTSTGYPIAWFWKYFAEQYGTSPNPGEGMDVIKAFWDTSRAFGTAGIDAVNRVLADVRPGTTFEDVYKDFIVANYARKLSDPGLPAKYRYADEAEAAPGPLRAVKLDVDQSVGLTDQIGPLVTGVAPWGARYYSISPQSSVPIISVDVHQDTSHRLFYTLLAVRGGRIISEERFTGRHFARALANAAYDRVVLIVAGLDRYANYRLTINGQRPVLNIVDPLQARPAQVTAGSPAIRDTFLVKVEVLDAAAQPVLGLDTTAFTVTVGTTVVPASDLITSAYLQGQYWLLVRAPNQAAGLYDLRVQWSALNDVETQAVNYAPRATSDNVLVIDRSGSMLDFNKLTAAKNAGRLYIDSWPNGDRIGVVSFSSDAIADLTLRLLDDAARDAARTAVNNLVGGGGTSIGDGATTAMNELINRGGATDRWAIILLSDGMETAPTYIPDFMALYNARKDATPPQKVPVVHTVALGADADRPTMDKLARDTGGTFQYAAEPGAADSPAATNINLPLDLAEIYRAIAEAVDPQQQIYSAQHMMADQTHLLDVPILVDAAAAEGVFTLNWADPYTSGMAQLLDPDNLLITSGILADTTHYTWRVPFPKEGVWHLRVDCFAIEFCATTYLVEAALKSPLGIQLYFNPGPEGRKRGIPVDLVVSLADTHPVKGATVSADILAPDGTSRLVRLYDDGAHRDGAADDGLYGGRFFQTFLDGSYVARVTASGVSNLESPFVRRIQRAFDVAPDADEDQDGMPDGWEEQNGTDPAKPDGELDPDLDGLPSYIEFQLGTDPHDPDTDDGGEGDGSEVQHGKDPLNPADDGAKIQGELHVQPGKGFNVLTYTPLPGVSQWLLFVSTNPDEGYSPLNTPLPLTGVFTHTNLFYDIPYWYSLVGIGANGEMSLPTQPVSATPVDDPLPPNGSVLINEGAEETTSLEVDLFLQAQDDARAHTPNDRVATLYEDALSTGAEGVEMRIANDPSFEEAVWEPFSSTRAWRLHWQGGPAIVYVQFRDDAGNLSPVVSDYIYLYHHLWLPRLAK